MVLAARGARNLDQGEEKIADESGRAALRKSAMKIHASSLALAVLLFLLAFMLSGAF